MSRIIDAKVIESFVLEDLKEQVERIHSKLGKMPQFMIINASNDPANRRYIKSKMDMAEKIGLSAAVVEFGEDVTNVDIINYIKHCNEEDVPVIVQLPLYKHLNKELIIRYIQPHVDADGFTNEWIARTYTSNTEPIQPATPKGVMGLLDYYLTHLEGQVALVIGTGKHTGQALANMLMNEGATVITANEYTKDLTKLTKMADIIISCVGKPNLFGFNDVKANATVIGVGFSYVDGKQVQDFNEQELPQCKFVSNRINCTGKMTVLALMDNIVELYNINLGL